jgi:uncharacterized membrane protein YcaP (DUF421 family)
VITVALGSTLSSILLQESVALAEGVLALAVLIGIQFLITFASVRSPKLASYVRSSPALLAGHGQFCRETMKRERVTEEEVVSTIRGQGGESIDDAWFAILESDGSISVSLKRVGGQ